MDPVHLSLIVAFGAGALSFASPCVLPLVPAYIGHLAGRSVGKEPDAGQRSESAGPCAGVCAGVFGRLYCAGARRSDWSALSSASNCPGCVGWVAPSWS